MFDFFVQNLLFSEGFYVLLVFLVLLIIGFFWMRPLFYMSLVLITFSFYFFRNPDRQVPLQEKSIVAPADGTVIDISTDPVDTNGYAARVSIFLSLWDVHVQRAPVAGQIETIAYYPGAFFKAYLPKSAKENEHNDIVIKLADGRSVMVRQIAGVIARRISCWIAPGESVLPCQKIGMIRFGSRVDLFIPEHARFIVNKGDQVYGGSTLIGYTH